MSSAPQWYIERHETIHDKCVGCIHVVPLRFGRDSDRLICNRYPYPHNKFLFSLDNRCEDYRLSSASRELISLIENILMKLRNVKLEEVDGNREKGRL